jgi:threonine synthase
MQPGVDHVLKPQSTLPSQLTNASFPSLQNSPNPFIKYRSAMYPYRTALARGMTDAEYVELVEELDSELFRIDGTGFRETPLLWHAPLNAYLKLETAQVGQSHKARHLFSAMLYLMVHQRTGANLMNRRLAVASCGNAGLAAAVVAAAAKWPIDVCIPPTADLSVKERLAELGADIKICDRAADSDGGDAVEGDPCVTAFRSLVAGGGIPLSVQGPECWASVEGGQTLAWEVASMLANDGVKEIGQIFVQVGGGALGAGALFLLFWLFAHSTLVTVSSCLTCRFHPTPQDSCRAWSVSWTATWMRSSGRISSLLCPPCGVCSLQATGP